MKSKLSLITAGKSLGIHFYGMVWEAASTESPRPRGRSRSGAELLLSPLVPVALLLALIPFTFHLSSPCRQSALPSPCPHPGLLHAGSVTTELDFSPAL